MVGGHHQGRRRRPGDSFDTGRAKVGVERGEWEAIQVEQVASMEEFDYSHLWEKGAVIEVADYWGAGAATMTVEDTKGGTEALTYENMRVTPIAAVYTNGIRVDPASFQFMKIEEMALVKVDLADNTRIDDGYYCMVRLGTIDTNGEQISFTVVVDGNQAMKLDPKELFVKMKRGDSVRMSLSTIPFGGITIDDLEKILKKNGITEEAMPKRLFNLLGYGSQSVSLADVRKAMREGAVLNQVIGVNDIKRDNPGD